MEDVANSDPPDFDTLAQHDSQLHIEIANCSGNSVLVRIMRAIQGTHRDQLQTSLRYRDRVHQTVRDHQRIVSAILAGDPVEAGNAMTDHLDNGETATLSSIEGIADKTRSE
jgi:DNA-binding FadR family transcriptional regulator